MPSKLDQATGTGDDARMQPAGRRAQIALFRSVAGSALRAYDLSGFDLRLLKHRHNTTFCVETATGHRFVLRINRAGTPTIAGVGAELAWLAAIRRDTSLQVPEPVPNRAGSLLTLAAGEHAQGRAEHICVLFRWVDGRSLDAGLRPVHLRHAGELMAQLHEHSLAFGPSQPLARGRVDGLTAVARGLPDPFAPEIKAACRDLVARTLSAPESEQVAAVIERAHGLELELAGEGAAVGLIHADLHHYNLLFARGQARAIDFDDCGFGPLLYDLAVPLWVVHGRKDYPALRAGLLAGYRRIRALPPAHEARIDAFIALRCVQDALWTLETRHHPAIGPDWKGRARRLMAPLAGYFAAGGRFG